MVGLLVVQLYRHSIFWQTPSPHYGWSARRTVIHAQYTFPSQLHRRNNKTKRGRMRRRMRGEGGGGAMGKEEEKEQGKQELEEVYTS